MVYSVSQINRRIAQLLRVDSVLKNVTVSGEISGYRGANVSSGHIYFKLKDENSVISCVLYSWQLAKISVKIKEGQKVEIDGEITVYEAGGYYNLKVNQIRDVGEGRLYAAYLELKNKLNAEGLFDPDHHKEIPKYSRLVGIVTSSTGAAIQDIRNIASRRNPYVQLVLAHASVQGKDAAASIIKALKKLDDYGCDVIIAGRGGGSIEDLWCFNDEELARTVYSMKTPVISAVGHETDYTILDFVADMRAPTPSAAAELAIFSFEELEINLVDRHAALYYKMQSAIDHNKEMLSMKSRMLKNLHPRSRLEQRAQQLDEKQNRLTELMNRRLALLSDSLESDGTRLNTLLKRKIESNRLELKYKGERLLPILKSKHGNTKQELQKDEMRLSHLINNTLNNTKHSISLFEQSLRRLSPLEKISGGYAYVSSSKGQIRSIEDVECGENIQVTVKDGSLECEVKSRKHKELK